MNIAGYRLAGMQMKCLTQMLRSLTSNPIMIQISHNTREHRLPALLSIRLHRMIQGRLHQQILSTYLVKYHLN